MVGDRLDTMKSEVSATPLLAMRVIEIMMIIKTMPRVKITPSE